VVRYGSSWSFMFNKIVNDTVKLKETSVQFDCIVDYYCLY